jgi:C-terminal processing protease CtpA/Prc
LETEHEIIDDKPVVLLTNCMSVSMSEMTAQAVKLMPNGTIIGKRTHGGLCGLTDNNQHSLNYSGYIGVDGVTPVYGYVPTLASFTMDKEQLEGYGITPDIEVDFDYNEFIINDRDTQLDRALQFIRTGK